MSGPRPSLPLRAGRFAPALTLTLALAFLVTAASIASGAELKGRVVRVIDGDSIVVRSGPTSRTIRLEGIDAPEREQPFFAAARKALSRKVLNQDVRVVVSGEDRYHRTLGVVHLGKTSVNRWMVAQGWAWHASPFSSDRHLADAQEAARRGKLGLWRDPEPVSPWNWRFEKRSGAHTDPVHPPAGKR